VKRNKIFQDGRATGEWLLLLLSGRCIACAHASIINRPLNLEDWLLPHATVIPQSSMSSSENFQQILEFQ
jgi:hypothetical protein